ncbi:AAA family ATPase [Acidisphaera sp. L21]|uniref:ATP-binding protein n=1 Tax=Acidisphaera sp. L21 TaxID=1641851 RepID=UPI00131D0D51
MEEWLRSLGLEDRIAAFQAERITLAEVPSLTDEDLRGLGLLLGERRRFQREVAARWPAPPPDAIEAERAHRLVQGERRPLTVMFIDIVNSTGLGEQIGDEAMLDVLTEFRERCAAAINRMGGYVAKFLGDGILAYFCYPVAHENDPLRAVRAGLEINGAMESIRPYPDLPLAVRIGIATGSVILSDLFDGDGPDPLSATGSVLNLAARLQVAAPPGGVVVGNTTYDRVGHLFVTEDLGLRELKGLGEPVRCWRVVREASGLPRTAGFDVTLPLRGRSSESATLDMLWQEAKAGAGRVVLIRGEAGVGKSALVESFMRRNGLSAGAVVTLAGSDLDFDTPFFPIAQYLRDYAAVNGAARARRLRDAATGGEVAADLIAQLAGLPFDAARLADVSARQQRDRTLAALSDMLIANAGAGPGCILVEDAHWLDPSTSELLARLFERVGPSGLLLLLTTRPDLQPFWPAESPIVDITLDRLGQDEVRAMAADLLGTADMPASLLARIVERTDGVPLFVQAVIRQIRLGFTGTGSLRWGDGHGQDVPSSLQEALMARLDRAGVSKELAQAASVIGRRVNRVLLGLVMGLPRPELDESLLSLVEGGVLRRDTASADDFVFSHALVRDIAYSSLLRDTRRHLHERAAGALQRLHPNVANDQPAILALHLTEAGQFAAAAECWVEAGRRAVATSAITEASRLLRRGLAAVEATAASPERAKLEVELLALLGPVLMALNGPGAAETREHYDRSYELCRSLAEEPAHFPLYWGWQRLAKDFRIKRERTDWILQRAHMHGDPGALMQAHHCNWASTYNLGQFERCCEHIEAGLALYGEDDWRQHATVYGHDARACGHGQLAFVHWMQGRTGGGRPHHERSLGWARQLRHRGSLVHSMDCALTFHAMRQSHAAAFKAAEELADATIEHGLADYEAKVQIYRGWATAVQEDAAGGLRLLREGFARQKDIGTSEDFPIFVCLLAEALLAAGNPERALTELVAARSQFAATGLRIWLPEVLRITAAAMAACRSGLLVQPILAEAADIATAQGVATLGLRIAADRGAALAQGGDLAEAVAVLQQGLDAAPDHEGAEWQRADQALNGLHQRLRVKQAC